MDSIRKTLFTKWPVMHLRFPQFLSTRSTLEACLTAHEEEEVLLRAT
jgi:hypothetical protein